MLVQGGNRRKRPYEGKIHTDTEFKEEGSKSAVRVSTRSFGKELGPSFPNSEIYQKDQPGPPGRFATITRVTGCTQIGQSCPKELSILYTQDPRQPQIAA